MSKLYVKQTPINTLGKNMLRLFHILAWFTFTTSEVELDYNYHRVIVPVALPVEEKLVTKDLIKSENFKENTQNASN